MSKTVPFLAVCLSSDMDHFCPWIANTVGYHNRKFFVLFLGYVWLTSGYAGLSLVFIHRNVGTNGPPQMALALCFALCACMTAFGGFHVKMVLTNETSIEQGPGSHWSYCLSFADPPSPFLFNIAREGEGCSKLTVHVPPMPRSGVPRHPRCIQCRVQG
eukprot:SAG22_NODE_3442_length_1709_cov_1.330435_2_plen_159_part_00